MSLEETAQKLGMSAASMKMRIQNIKSADVGCGLTHIAKQTRSVLSRFDGWSEAKLRAKVRTHLAPATRRSKKQSLIKRSTLTIRQLDEKTKTRLRVRAAQHGRSMEQEAREILRSALRASPAVTENLSEAIRKRFAEFGGLELTLPRRDLIREAPKFGE